MNRADATDPNEIDQITDLYLGGAKPGSAGAWWDRDPAQPDYRADQPWPQVTADHGAQPRYRKRSRDPWRPDPFADGGEPPPSKAETSASLISRALAGIAREHAPKLASVRRTSADIEDIIETKIMPIARWTAKDLPPTARDRVLREFRDLVRGLLKNEVALCTALSEIAVIEYRLRKCNEDLLHPTKIPSKQNQ